jgi:hypothetical protein
MSTPDQPIWRELMKSNADDSVKEAMATAVGLRAFLGSIDKLNETERHRVVDQAITLLEGFYVHLPFKRAMYGIDPVRRLRLLKRRIDTFPSEIAFHAEMAEIFTSLRDLHTRYQLPSYFAQMVAFLPFRAEVWYDDGGIAHYIVAKLATGYQHESFTVGVELCYYNGVPFERAVEIAAEKHAGSNPAARRARGLAGLTKRAMNVAPPPDEEWAVVGYTDDGGPKEVRLDWTISRLPAELDQPSSSADPAIAASLGLDLEGDTFGRLDRMLFTQEEVKRSRQYAGHRQRAKMAQEAVAPSEAAQAGAEALGVDAITLGTDSLMPLVFSARPVPTGAPRAAFVRIHTFLVDDHDDFVNEFLRLITLPTMPKEGLILDVRGNGGGLIPAAERLLQLLTPRTIEPCRAQFISTVQNLSLSKSATLEPWRPSLESALDTGAFPITPPERCNDIGQRYYGPVVLITDARCYSATDIFAAGFHDHKVGKILGVDETTGAGGANVWTLDRIRDSFVGAQLEPPFEPLPHGSGMRVAIRRALRVGEEAGTEIEDLGVKPDLPYRISRNDILAGNRDLIDEALKLLSTLPVFAFDLTVTETGDAVKLDLATKGVDYVEVSINRRVHRSFDVVDDRVTIDLDAPVGTVVDLRGCRGTGELVCARRWTRR